MTARLYAPLIVVVLAAMLIAAIGRTIIVLAVFLVGLTWAISLHMGAQAQEHAKERQRRGR